MNGKIALGALFFFGGLLVTIISFSSGDGGGILAWGAILYGGYMLLSGLNDDGATGHEHDGYTVEEGGHRPAKMLHGHIRAADYPARAQREEREGNTLVGFTIDEKGGVQDVRTVVSSGHDDLDEAACRLIRERFRFEPASDADGYAVSETRTQEVNWRLA